MTTPLTPAQLGERMAELLIDAPMYAAQDTEVGYRLEPCPEHGRPDDPDADECPECGIVLDEPPVDAMTWYVVIHIRGRRLYAEGVGDTGAIDAASRAMEQLRAAWRVLCRDMFRQQLARARKANRPVHVRIKSRYPLPPELDEDPVAIDLLPGGMKAYVFEPSQVRRMMRALR